MAANTLYTIGIVDDNQQMRDAMCGVLRAHGYQVLAFDSARALLSSASLAQFDCIVSDLQMPDMNGLEMQDALRLAGHRMPLIMVTAFPDPAMRLRALQGGARAFLGKPLQARELIQCIEAAVERR